MSDVRITQSVPERMLDLLEAEGIRHLFGIPDPCFVSMFLAAEARDWEVIAPHHEQAGGFMADGLWRLTGKPAVIIGNEGPGVANLVPAAICAAKEHIPTIFIAGQRERVFDQSVRRGHFQYTPQSRFFEAAMKYVGVIEFPQQVDEIFHEAFRQALSGNPGPVYIEYPKDYAFVEHEFGPILPPHKYRLTEQKAADSAIQKAVDLLHEAQQPIIFLGAGAFSARAGKIVEELVKTIDCPVVQTTSANGALNGIAGRVIPYATPVANDLIADADVVLAIGTEIGEPVHFGTGRHWAVGKTDRKWIYVERDPVAIGANRPIDVPLVGDLRDIVPQLTKVVAEKGEVSRMPAGFAEKCAAFQAELNAILESVPTDGPIHPALLQREATRQIPKNSVVVRDGGATQFWYATFNQQPDSEVIWSANFGHLGTGLPYAIGAALAVGDERRVVLVTGDGSFMFHISELETAVRKNLPIVCIVQSDYAWGLEVCVYKTIYGDDSTETEARFGDQIRFDKIAEGFGAYGEFVEDLAEIGPAVARAFASGRPAVIQVPVNSRIHATEMPGIEELFSWYGEEGYSAAPEE